MNRLCGEEDNHVPHKWTISTVDKVFFCEGLGFRVPSILRDPKVPGFGLEWESWEEGSICREYIKIAFKYNLPLTELREWHPKDIATWIELAEKERQQED